jgi:hypothetical protein
VDEEFVDADGNTALLPEKLMAELAMRKATDAYQRRARERHQLPPLPYRATSEPNTTAQQGDRRILDDVLKEGCPKCIVYF